MPTYGYRCKECSYEFEETQKFSDSPLVECPSCKKNALVRIISSSGLVFKGSGFYLTDYKKPAKEEPKKSPTKKETKSETKPESKPSDSSSSKSSGDSAPSSKE